MTSHERLIELSTQKDWSDSECFEIIKIIEKSSLPFGVMLIDAILLLRNRGKLMGNENSKFNFSTLPLTFLEY